MPSTISAGTTAGTAIAIAGDTTGNLAFQTNGTTTAMTINTSQNVGIGTTTPTFTSGGGLQVKGSGFTSVRLTSASSTGVDFSQDTSSNGYMYNRDNAALIYGTNNTERMRIDSSGNVGIGTSSPSARLTVNVTGSTQGIVSSSVNNHGTYSEATGTGYGLYGRAYNAAYGGVVGYDSNNTVYGILGIGGYGLSTNASINVNGTIYASDGRLKENVKPINNALETINKLNPVSFDWKADSARGVTNKNTPLPDYGMIAQEVEKVLPDIVYETKTPARPKEAENTKTLEDDLGSYKGVDYSRLIPFLAKAIQELKAELDATKAEVAALKGA